jgi:[acyl-carrier-protein] S-malonyltransferase
MKTAFVFPGQGAQAPGMGRELAMSVPVCREVFASADQALAFEISALCFEGTAADLALTENTQPAILTVSIAAWRALAARGIEPQATAGHSLGEYSAHVAAGTIPFADAVRSVRARGRFMQEAVPVGHGAMAAILGLELEQVQEVCAAVADHQVVEAANINAPGQIVLAGHTAAVKRAIEACREAGARRAVELAVSAPFHSSLMKPAAERLAPILEEIPFADPAVPVYTNVDAAPVSRGTDARDALVRQVASPVRWQELVERMANDGFDTFVEIGPGKVLSGLARRIRSELRTVQVADPAGIDAAVEFLGAHS